jgi:FkbM family methyltransferase
VGKNVALDIVGGISESFANQEFDRVNFLGMVEDLSLAYRRCDVILLPITNGGGIAIKTLEAIQYGKPIVATRHALRGLPENVPGLLEGCLSEKEFIDDLAALVEDPAARLERAKVVRRIGKVLEDCCFDLLMHRELDAICAYARLGKVSQEHDLRPKPAAATGSSQFTVPGSVALKPLRINRNDTRLEVEILGHIRAFYLGSKHYAIPRLACEESLRTDGDVAYVAEMMKRTQPHDDDYQIFRIFQDPDSLILDLGANWGYSVGSLGAVGARSHIVSVEAIPSHEPCLAEVKRLRQDGFNYFITGLSDHSGSLQFVTPVVNDVGLSALSSASEDVSFEYLAKNVVSYIKTWIDDDKLCFRLCTSEVPVTTLDRMVQDHPDIFSHRSVVAIKVDVEGWETEVLRGGTQLLRSHRPLVMAEGGNRYHGVRELMASLDYCFAERQGEKLVFQEGIGVLSNGFFLHPSRLEEYRSAGIL